jgi:methyl-accepting chemotaxis protein
MMILAIQSVDPQALDALQKIATAQFVVAAVMVLIGLLAIGAAILVMLEFRSASKLLHNAADSLDDLKPRLAPLIDRASRVTDDVSGMTDNIRRRVDDALHTLEELRRSVERAGAATEARVQRFTAVLDVVQGEAEELLLDAAATARGLHETARTLQEPGRKRRAQLPAEQEDG